MRRFVLLMAGLSPIMIVTIALAQTAAGQQPNEPVANRVIYGLVVDQEGQPAKAIKLIAFPLGVPLATTLPYTRTDQDGRYRLTDIPWWGRYTVYAEDEAAGYSMSNGQLIDLSDKIEEVTLSPQHAEAELDLRLPPKAGFLEIHPSNKETGAAITQVEIQVLLPEKPERPVWSRWRPSNCVILVPPGKEVLLHVTCPGFREWAESVGKGKPLRVPSGDRLTLNVELKPSD